MKYVFFLVVSVIGSNAFADDSYVQGYYRKNGTYVQGYHRSTTDNTINNNYGTSGNANPYTGQNGHVPQNPNQGAGNYNMGNGMGGTPTFKHNSYGNSYGLGSGN